MPEGKPIVRLFRGREHVRDVLLSKDMLATLARSTRDRTKAELLASIALRTVLTNEKLFQNCAVETVCGAIIQAVQLGLEPDNVSGLAYLVPFYDKNLHANRCQLIVGYRGFLQLVYRSCRVTFVHAENVWSNDHFTLRYDQWPPFEHQPTHGERGEYVGTYARALDGNVTVGFEYMRADEIEKLRERSRAKDAGPWVTDTDEMRRKCALRRLCKKLPQSATDLRLQQAVSLDEAVDAGLNQVLPTFGPVDESEKGTLPETDQAIEAAQKQPT